MKNLQTICRPGFLAMLLLMLSRPAAACLNGFSNDVYVKSQAKSTSQYPLPLGHPIDTKDEIVLDFVERWKSEWQEGSYKSGIDYGLFLVYDKQFAEAEEFFRMLVAKWPDKYEAVANLGTVLEIVGKNEEALKWLQKSLELNPTAHNGSEWIHVKILEAKLASDAGLDVKARFGIDFGTEDIPRSTRTKRELKLLQKDLFYQLNERISFVAPPDPYIGPLMFELGNITLAVGQCRVATQIYRLAQTYGFQNELIKQRYKLAKKRL